MASRRILKKSFLCLTAAALALPVAEATPAKAGNGFGPAVIGGAIGAAIGTALMRNGQRQTHRSGPSRPKGGGGNSSDGDTTASSDPSKASRALASMGVPSKTQTAVLKGITPAAVLGAVGTTENRRQVGETYSRDEERDYTTRISKLIEKFKDAQESQKSSAEGDITQHGVLQALDDAIRRSNLEIFSTFVGENWTRERLRVLILDSVDGETDMLLAGTNRGRVSMSELRSVIDRAADLTYLRLFETSELLAANRSSAQFVQLLYQAHGELVFDGVREGTERMLSSAANKVTGDFDMLIRRDSRAYALGYRKQRIVFDCLSENIVGVTSAVQGLATREEVAARIDEIAATECRGWAAAQFVTGDNRLGAQQPVPLRVVWTKAGPADDQSMYRRAGSTQ